MASLPDTRMEGARREMLRVRGRLRMTWTNITIEPVVLLYCIIDSLSGISSEELYLQKACLVNLNYSVAVCSNLTQQDAIQLETQQKVSAVQVRGVQDGILNSNQRSN